MEFLGSFVFCKICIVSLHLQPVICWSYLCTLLIVWNYFLTVIALFELLWRKIPFLMLLSSCLGGIFETTYFTSIILMLSCCVLLYTFFSFFFILTVFTFKTNTLFTGIFLVISSFFNDFTVFNWVITWLLNIFITVCFRWRISLLLQMLLPPSEVSFQWPLMEF